mmetsp:Transcript_1230/g.1405  ORF Transcript_1230/g.1405 Transcript_1230/m.1405 type:complete len:84 (+) Transcript_1230:110-361(+)
MQHTTSNTHLTVVTQKDTSTTERHVNGSGKSPNTLKNTHTHHTNIFSVATHKQHFTTSCSTAQHSQMTQSTQLHCNDMLPSQQ